jgi:ribosomal protein L37E
LPVVGLARHGTSRRRTEEERAMTQTDEEFGHEVHYAMVAIKKRVGKRSFNQQKRACEAWLAKYVPQVEARGLTEEVISMPRTVAEHLLREAIIAQRPARAFEPLVRHLEALGWRSLEQKERSICAMCGYFAERMWKREGLRYLLPLKREVEEEYARTGDKMWADTLAGIARLERRLRARGRPF